MMCAATVNWTLFTDTKLLTAQYVMLNGTIGCTFFREVTQIAENRSVSNDIEGGVRFRSRFATPRNFNDNGTKVISADHIDLDPFVSSQARERTLNAAIIQANISESFEEYLEIFDAFYADDIEISGRNRERTDSSERGE